MASLETAICDWIGDGRIVSTLACDDILILAQAVLGDFWSNCPEHRTTDNAEALAQLEEIAKTAGFENVERFVGSAVIHGNGDMALEVRAV